MLIRPGDLWETFRKVIYIYSLEYTVLHTIAENFTICNPNILSATRAYYLLLLLFLHNYNTPHFYTMCLEVWEYVYVPDDFKMDLLYIK